MQAFKLRVPEWSRNQEVQGPRLSILFASSNSFIQPCSLTPEFILHLFRFKQSFPLAAHTRFSCLNLGSECLDCLFWMAKAYRNKAVFILSCMQYSCSSLPNLLSVYLSWRCAKDQSDSDLKFSAEHLKQLWISGLDFVLRAQLSGKA